jgi:hypothetical protein
MNAMVFSDRNEFHTIDKSFLLYQLGVSSPQIIEIGL